MEFWIQQRRYDEGKKVFTSYNRSALWMYTDEKKREKKKKGRKGGRNQT